MEHVKCGNCGYFDKFAEDGRSYDGNCCRFPQTVPKKDEDLCGEYKPEPESK